MPVIQLRRDEDLREIAERLTKETATGELVGLMTVCLYSDGSTDWYAVMEGRKATVALLGESEICRVAVAELYAAALVPT